jgi:outer membrane protein OmpA-like peptidoglycan-associated protein
MPAVSKAQQRFMGMVHAADKGETPASPEVAKVSADMKDSDAKDFASTKHDGLPDHVKEQLKSVVREVIREKSGMNEMSGNDVHFKHIMKMYDRGGSFTKKKIGAVVCKDPKASRKDIEDVLFDSDYKEITEFEDELGLKEIREKYNSVKEDATELPQATIPAAVKAKLQLAIEKIKDSKLSNNAKLQLLAQVIDAIGIDKSQLSNIASKIRSKMESVVTEEFKHIIHVDTPTQVVSKPVAAQIMALAKKGVRASEIGLEMGFVGNAKLAADTFQKVKNKIYFELDKRNESVNEALSKDAVVRTLTSDKNAYFLTKDGNGWILDITPKAAQQSTFHQKFDVKDLGKGHLGMKYKLSESVNEEHDCGCNENHDCGCGGVHEHHIKEDLSADANGIAGLTASRANAVKDFLEKNNINSNKLYLFLKKGNLKDRMDFVTALVGKPGNPIQKKVISQFSN